LSDKSLAASHLPGVCCATNQDAAAARPRTAKRTQPEGDGQSLAEGEGHEIAEVALHGACLGGAPGLRGRGRWNEGLEIAEIEGNMLQGNQLIAMRNPPARTIAIMRAGAPSIAAL
jgi:hypothetical protein